MCFRSPQIMDVSVFGWVKALDEPVSKQGPCFAGKCKGLLCNIFDAHLHGGTI